MEWEKIISVTMVLLFVRMVNTEVGNRLLVINFQAVQVQAISAFYNPYEMEEKVHLGSEMV